MAILARPAAALELRPLVARLEVELTQTTWAMFAQLLTMAVLLWAFFVIRRLIRDDVAARRRIVELEGEINEAEAALRAEPHLLLIWRGRNAEPDRIIGDMRDTAKVPATRETLLDFGTWLEPESASALAAAAATLRETGVSFNIGIRTKRGELLEADGRAAGRLATLRLRPLSGERRHITELAYDARKLSKQVERLSAILDGAPLPI